jgi:hypothetical protein
MKRYSTGVLLDTILKRGLSYAVFLRGKHMLKKILFAVPLSIAFAAVGQTVAPMPGATPTITITGPEVDQLRAWALSSGPVSQRMPDGSTHLLVDGTNLIQFIDSKIAQAKSSPAQNAPTLSTTPSASVK